VTPLRPVELQAQQGCVVWTVWARQLRVHARAVVDDGGDVGAGAPDDESVSDGTDYLELLYQHCWHLQYDGTQAGGT